MDHAPESGDGPFCGEATSTVHKSMKYIMCVFKHPITVLPNIWLIEGDHVRMILTLQQSVVASTHEYQYAFAEQFTSVEDLARRSNFLTILEIIRVLVPNSIKFIRLVGPHFIFCFLISSKLIRNYMEQRHTTFLVVT